MPLHRTLRRISHTSVVHFRPTHTCPAIRIVPILELQILCTEPLRFGEDFGWFGASPLRLCCFLNGARPFQHVVLDLKRPLGARTRRSKVKGILRPFPPASAIVPAAQAAPAVKEPVPAVVKP